MKSLTNRTPLLLASNSEDVPSHPAQDRLPRNVRSCFDGVLLKLDLLRKAVPPFWDERVRATAGKVLLLLGGSSLLTLLALSLVDSSSTINDMTSGNKHVIVIIYIALCEECKT